MSQITQIAQIAQPETFQLSPLYRMGAHGKTLIWTISFDGQALVMEWGPMNGKLRSSRTVVKTNSTGRNVYEQSLLEAQARRKRKQDKDGYVENMTTQPVIPSASQPVSLTQPDVSVPQQNDLYNMTAMLANPWDPTKKQIKRWPVWIQEKLDGVRCRSHIIETQDRNEMMTAKQEQKVVLMSRNKLEFAHLDHIRVDLAKLFTYIARYLPNEKFRTDGELYTMNLTFDQISGITRLKDKSAPNANEGYIKYYLFDIITEGSKTYDERFTILNNAFQDYLKDFPDHSEVRTAEQSNLRILSYRVAQSPQDILTAHDQFTSEGYEGVIIRKIGGSTEKERTESYYIGRRCSNILKYKSFQDAEGIVIGAEEGNGSEAGAVIWLVKDTGERTLTIRPRGDINLRKWYFENYQNFVGQKFRYRFQELTPDGYPRFPVGVGFVFDR